MAQFASTLYPQTNPTNPILLAVRDYRSDRLASSTSVAALFLRNWNILNVVEATRSQRDHARLVLTRLVSLSG